MVQLPEPAIWDGVLERGSFWSDVDESEVIKSMNEIYHKYDEWKEKGKEQGKIIRENWTAEKMGKKLVDLILSLKIGVNPIINQFNQNNSIPFKKIN